MLEQRVAHLEDAVEKVFTLQKLARLYEEKLERVDGAFEALYKALREEPRPIREPVPSPEPSDVVGT